MRVPDTSRVLLAVRKACLAKIRCIALTTFSILFLNCIVSPGPADAQTAPQSILELGDAVTTGFSGVVPPDAPLPPGVDPADRTYIDLDGPSARVVDLQNLGGPPTGQLVDADKPFTVTADQIGQVFAVALDSEMPPNIYVAATSTYGLPIVGPDADGDGLPDRLRLGQPNASFMRGLWGEADPEGGPGSIWKIDGVTGELTLFANVTLDGTPNSGPALGGLAFDPATNQLFAVDRDTGMIHRFSLDGVERGRYDHGTTGRKAAGLPPMPFDPANRLDIASPAFNSENPATWGYAPAERLIFGIGVRGNRLYYATGLTVWSVSIGPDGAIGDDAEIEIEVPPALAQTEIAKIAFDGLGRMLLAERGIPTGAYDFSVLAQESVSRVLRYARIIPAPDEPPIWQPKPDEYAVGLALQNRNATGGVAVGYGYDRNGRLDRYTCEGTIWSTGEQLRRSPDPAAAKQLAASGPLDVDGLQGSPTPLVRPDNVPPMAAYFIDFDDGFENEDARGHAGDIAIARICGAGEDFAWTGGAGWFPPGYLPPDFGLPPPPPPPPPGPVANLRLDKDAIPPQCVAWGPGWLCRYRVRVTSTGPGPYVGPIVVSDWLPADPAGAIMGFGFAPWACAPTGPTSFDCLHPPTVLNPGDSINLQVAAWVPNAYPHCNLVNSAEIVWAPGGDFNPADDFDSAVAAIPAKACPPKDKQTNLLIEKESLGCQPTAAPMHRCRFRVRITNTGPGVYQDHIHFTDTIPAGASATFISPIANPFTCAGGPPTYTCQSDNPVTLNPTQQVSLIVRVDVPNAEAPALKCLVRNEASITFAPGGTPQNTNAADDTAEATANLPAALCPIIIVPFFNNLSLEKDTQNPLCHGVAGGWECNYTVRVRNTGPAAFSGEIRVRDWLPPGMPAGTTVSFSSPQPWNCVNVVGHIYRCTINANLALNQSRHFNVRVFVPLNHAMCQLTNSARIILPPSPSLQNTLAADDLDSATAQFAPLIAFPADFYCVAPAVHEPAECGPNEILNRASGECLPIKIAPPKPPVPPAPPPPPAPDPCKPGQIRDKLSGECFTPPPVCKPGQIYDPRARRCVTLPPPCKPGDVRDPKSGQCITPPPPPCPQGQVRDARGRCVAPPPPPCPTGQKRDPRTGACVAPPPPPCPQGQTRSPRTGECVTPPPPPCPKGQKRDPRTGACVAPPPPPCPQGQVRDARGRCVVPPPPPCPQGQTRDPRTGQCVTAPTQPTPCPQGQRRDPRTGQCVTIAPPPCPQGQVRDPQGRCVTLRPLPPSILRPQQ